MTCLSASTKASKFGLQVSFHVSSFQTTSLMVSLIGSKKKKIITTNQRYHQRRCLEAWHINSAHAPLNRGDGGLLPDAYLHLINR